MARASAYACIEDMAEEKNRIAGVALARVFTLNKGALLRYLRARGAGEDAEDCVQELWIRAQLGANEEIDDPRAYLYRMAHNLMLDRIRTHRRRQNREFSFFTDIQGGAGDVDDAPAGDRILIARERLRHIDRALAALGSKTEYIFRRHRVEEVAQRDIAAQLGITLSAVEKHLQKAYRASAAAQRAFEAETNAIRTDKGPFDSKH